MSRASAGTVLNNFRAIVGMLVGLALVAVGVGVLVKELQVPPVHTAHVYISTGLIFFGALLVVPSVVTGSIRDIIVYVGPYIPVLGGRRAGDPPVQSRLAPIADSTRIPSPATDVKKEEL